jgi:hypothetical protein
LREFSVYFLSYFGFTHISCFIHLILYFSISLKILIKFGIAGDIYWVQLMISTIYWMELMIGIYWMQTDQ